MMRICGYCLRGYSRNHCHLEGFCSKRCKTFYKMGHNRSKLEKKLAKEAGKHGNKRA
jgi:hypothetical protein